MTVVLGIDVGFAALGIVVADGNTILAAEVLRTERTAAKRAVRVADDDAERCQFLARRLNTLIHIWQPAGAVAELPGGGAQGARPNRSMGLATGVVVTVLELRELPAEFVTPQAVKRAAAGRNDASKAAVEAAVRSAFTWQAQLPSAARDREHVCDAAGVLLAANNGTLLRVLKDQRYAGVPEGCRESRPGDSTRQDVDSGRRLSRGNRS